MEIMDAVRAIIEGGAGSGHWGHKGRPGFRGGSLPAGGGGVSAHVSGSSSVVSSSKMAQRLKLKGITGAAEAKAYLERKYPGNQADRYARALSKAGIGETPKVERIAGSAAAVAKALNEAPDTFSPQWIKDHQTQYDTDTQFKNTADALHLYAGGQFKMLRGMSKDIDRKDISAETKAIADSPMKGWRLEMPTFKNQSSENLNMTLGEAARALNDGIAASPRKDKILRGVQNAPQEMLNMKVGDSLPIEGATSFTTEKSVAWDFIKGTGAAAKGGAYTPPMGSKGVLLVATNVPALNVGAVSRWSGQKEWLTRGQFRISKIVDTETRPTTVRSSGVKFQVRMKVKIVYLEYMGPVLSEAVVLKREPEWLTRCLETPMSKRKIVVAESEIDEGGAGSGHWGHKGRPGMRGGSLPGAGGVGGVAAHRQPMTAGGKHRATTGGVHRAYTSSFMAKYLQKKIAQGRYNTWDAANRKLREKFPGQPTSRYGRALQKAGLVQGAAPVPRPVQAPRPVQPGQPVRLPTVIQAILGRGPSIPQAPAVPAPAGPPVTVNSHSGEQIVVDNLGVGLGPDREPFTQGRIIQERRLRGGINRGTVVIDLEGDGSAVRKTAAGEERGLRRQIAGGTYYRREAGAYAVARILGLDHLVPETYVRNEGGVSSVQKFVEDSKPASSVGYHKTDEIMRNDVRQLTEAAFFDFVIGNQDRHNGNYMVNEDTKRFALIDNGLSMAKDGHYLRSEFIFNASQGGKKIPADLVTRVMNTETSIYAALKKVGIEDAALANMQKRIKILKDLSQNGREDVSVRVALENYKLAVPAR